MSDLQNKTMKVKVSKILLDCIEAGVTRGYDKAHKHTPSPTRESIIDAIETCISGEIWEYFTFEEEEL